MCGFGGFYDSSLPADRAEHILTKMASCLVHRGPDDQGIWLERETGIHLAHRRLAVVDLSASGHQPMQSASGRYVMAFNGEVYNYQTLRAELEQRGTQWRGHSDTEVLLAGIETWGVGETLRRCVGMFALALWDRKARVLYLARDRLGEKPLYYGWMKGAFLFGSELKALRAHPAWQGEIERKAVTLFMRHNYIPTPFSIYKGIYKLPPGCFLALPWEALTAGKAPTPFPETEGSGGQMIAPVAYWSAWEAVEKGGAAPFRGSDEEAIAELEERLREAVAGKMVADVPLGAFLSGGIDSSMVAALMQAQSSQPVKTFSIGFHEQGYNEAVHAAQVARHLGTDHTELYINPQEAMAVIPRLPTLYDEPFADSSQIPTFLVSQLARRHVTVALSGDGGDELLGGYNRYFWCRRIWSKVGRIPRFARQMAAQGLRLPPPRVWDRVFASAGPFLPARLRQVHPGDKLHKLAAVLASDSPAVIYEQLISQWQNPSSIVINGSETSGIADKVWSHLTLTDLTERMMFLDLMTYLPDDILTKVDRASMAVSLEVRVPLLDHRLVEFAWRLPVGLKVREGAGKWMLRQILHRYVPKELVERPKMGFGVPIDIWLRGPLRDWTEDLLDESKLKREGYFHPGPIRQKWEEHLTGRRNWQYPLWCVLMFQAWLEAQ
ncbi:asparagine synthase (glutamine-hydrolyzing) [Nitrosococcus halophilus Nc 4]|uniref:asparagine synthase (glutamine-hydrolyzing) n=1 Tax=Nitrosococcus halophilus (strain Nc4) TaxID=472759 RepID=D5BX00_NITHN|nr:asparagine synthase (glutamine-hydrolyzing) [Nitrosococcus halophilus]ADE13881.1 asparagine synthase (glutamine-hydrolyzing) [Nitrosococcus halophilus Nc 4]